MRPSGTHPVLCPDQKFVPAILRASQKFALTGSTVVDACFGTEVTANARLLEPMQRTFYGRKAVGYCVAVIIASLLEVCASQAPPKNSNTEKYLKVENAAD